MLVDGQMSSIRCLALRGMSARAAHVGGARLRGAAGQRPGRWPVGGAGRGDPDPVLAIP